MDKNIKNILVIGIAAIIALKLFVFGLSFPLEFRARGDAYQYLAIANQFSDFQSVLAYAGPRTVGIPLVDFLIGKLAISLAPENSISLLAWVNAIGLALLTTHFVSAWLFSKWLRSVSLIRSDNVALALFFMIATYPALIGHTTTPLSDTLAVDLLLIGAVALCKATHSVSQIRIVTFSILAASITGFAILVRPGNLLPFAAALFVTLVFATLQSFRKAAVILAIAIGSVLVLLPFNHNCMQKYGTVCLQAPSTFNFGESAQAGLRGARILWQKTYLSAGHTPILPDDFMYRHFAQKCDVKHIVGIDQTSLTGCLLSRPLTLPVFLVKKWIGLFDHYRFTPYLEDATPIWLMSLSRVYDTLAWIGFSLFLLLPLLATLNKESRNSLSEKVVTPLAPLFLIVYCMVLLAQHTALHTEDRYGFPLIPLALATLAIHIEMLHQHLREYRKWLPVAIYGVLAGMVFVLQVRIWDHSNFF